MSAIAVDRPEGTGWTGPSELQADTAAGAEMVIVATEHAARFAAGALVHDRDGTFATEHLDELVTSGFLSADAPGARRRWGVVRARHPRRVIPPGPR